MLIPNKQAHICAEGCEEEYITHIFQIQLKHNLSALWDYTGTNRV